MTMELDFIHTLETKVREQLSAQRVGYLLGAGSSYLDGTGYPLAIELWDRIKDCITDIHKRNEIQAKLDEGANGIEHALDLLDDGGPVEGPHRHLVTAAIAELFQPLVPSLDHHAEFVQRLDQRPDPSVKVFNLNYDPLIERAAEHARVRLSAVLWAMSTPSLNLLCSKSGSVVSEGRTAAGSSRKLPSRFSC